MKRLIVAACAACLSIAFMAGPSSAVQKLGCAPPFDGPLTIGQVLVKYPPPPQVEDPYGAVASYDKNGDLKVCVLPLPPGSVNIVDNSSAT